MALSAGTARAKPIVTAAPFSANPGDFITLQGSGFGAKPRVFITPANSVVPTEIAVTEGRDNVLIVRIPKTMAFSLYTLKVYETLLSGSDGTQLNAPQIHHFDAPDLATGMENRVYGRNLNVGGATPKVTLLDTVTNAQLPATVTIRQTYMLGFKPPAGIIGGHAYKAIVSNGYGSVTSEATTLGHAAGNDYFKVGQVWAFDFITRNGSGYRAGVAGTKEADHHVFNVRTDVSLTKRALGDGVTNDAPAIQDALDRASKNGGGIVYLPAGTYNLGTTGIAIRPGVVLQGQSTAATLITYGPTTAQSSSFSMGATGVPDDGALTGIADLSLRNVDKLSQKVVNFGVRGGVISKFFIARVNWDLGTGSAINLKGDRIAIVNSTITQAVNHQGGDALTGGNGPLVVGPVSNFVLGWNSIKWATDQISINDTVNAKVESNHFTRSAKDTIVATTAQTSWSYIVKPIAVGDVISRRLGRQLSMQFGRNTVIYGNTFDVSDGTLKVNQNDGETILNESVRRDDTGVVTAASATTISADSKCSGVCTWNEYPNMNLFVVSGKGAGQYRHIVARNNNTFTLDKPWDLIPAAGDHFAIAVPSFENAVITNNTMNDNPIGIGLWAGMFLNTTVTNNRLTNNGGIYLDPKSTTNAFIANSLTFNTAKNMEIMNNTITNAAGKFPAYVRIGQTMISPASPWGTSLYGVEVRANRLTAKPGTFPYPYSEGFQNIVLYQGSTAYTENGVYGVTGTVMQGNACITCARAFTLNTGALYTVLWNNSFAKPVGIDSVFVYDTPIVTSSPNKSAGTITGND
ncbi:hypothetical protein CR492_17745 [Methylocella silvestris]|uniref:Rhamnogalacturonase A/B/Epimerase-like pectate lyase domain-containing protein n=2 Tax=Methylocella silvestris TaxID=199596 RepID=A0A2J7TCT2_METSI|nr:hypothetical protein CR492_17745 [Methylocella silvestris]